MQKDILDYQILENGLNSVAMALGNHIRDFIGNIINSLKCTSIGQTIIYEFIRKNKARY
jgi:hypothetical protein